MSRTRARDLPPLAQLGVSASYIRCLWSETCSDDPQNNGQVLLIAREPRLDDAVKSIRQAGLRLPAVLAHHGGTVAAYNARSHLPWNPELALSYTMYILKIPHLRWQATNPMLLLTFSTVAIPSEAEHPPSVSPRGPSDLASTTPSPAVTGSPSKRPSLNPILPPTTRVR